MKKFQLLSLLLLSASISSAQEKLDIERTRALALENEENIQIANRTVQQQEIQKKVASSYYLPSISAVGGALYQANDITETADVSINIPAGLGLPISEIQTSIPFNVSLKGAYLAGIQLNQAIYAGGKVRSSNKMAHIGVEIAEENKKMQEVNTVVEADQTYWTYIAVQSKVKLAEKNLALLEDLVQRIKDSYEVGYTNQNDFLKVNVEYHKAQLDLQKARNGLELTRMALCRITGFSLDTPIETDTTLWVNADLLHELNDSNISNRPEYQILEKQIQLADSKIKNTRADYLPQLGVSANYGAWGGVSINSMDLTSNGFSASAMLKIPLFNWGKGHQEIQLAELNKQIKNDEFNKNTELMLLEISQSTFTLNEAVLSINLCVENLAQASENRRICADSYELGKETISNLLIAQTQWQKAENELIEAKINFKLAETEYLRTTAQILVAK